MLITFPQVCFMVLIVCLQALLMVLCFGLWTNQNIVKLSHVFTEQVEKKTSEKEQTTKLSRRLIARWLLTKVEKQI